MALSVKSLLQAIEQNDEVAFKRAFDLNPSLVHSKHYRDAHTALHVAAATGKLLFIKELLRLGASFKAVDCNQETPLHVATRQGHLLVVKELLRDAGRRSCLKSMNRDGATPLHLAVAANNHDAVQLLVNAGARLDLTDRAGRTPLDLIGPDDHGLAAILSQGRQLTPGGGAHNHARRTMSPGLGGKWSPSATHVQHGSPACNKQHKDIRATQEALDTAVHGPRDVSIDSVDCSDSDQAQNSLAPAVAAVKAEVQAAKPATMTEMPAVRSTESGAASSNVAPATVTSAAAGQPQQQAGPCEVHLQQADQGSEAFVDIPLETGSDAGLNSDRATDVSSNATRSRWHTQQLHQPPIAGPLHESRQHNSVCGKMGQPVSELRQSRQQVGGESSRSAVGTSLQPPTPSGRYLNAAPTPAVNGTGLPGALGMHYQQQQQGSLSYRQPAAMGPLASGRAAGAGEAAAAAAAATSNLTRSLEYQPFVAAGMSAANVPHYFNNTGGSHSPYSGLVRAEHTVPGNLGAGNGGNSGGGTANYIVSPEASSGLLAPLYDAKSFGDVNQPAQFAPMSVAANDSDHLVARLHQQQAQREKSTHQLSSAADSAAGPGSTGGVNGGAGSASTDVGVAAIQAQPSHRSLAGAPAGHFLNTQDQSHQFEQQQQQLAPLAAIVSARTGPLQQPLQTQLNDLCGKVQQLEALFGTQVELIPEWQKILVVLQNQKRHMEQQQLQQHETAKTLQAQQQSLQDVAKQLCDATEQASTQRQAIKLVTERIAALQQAQEVAAAAVPANKGQTDQQLAEFSAQQRTFEQALAGVQQELRLLERQLVLQATKEAAHATAGESQLTLLQDALASTAGRVTGLEAVVELMKQQVEQQEVKQGILADKIQIAAIEREMELASRKKRGLHISVADTGHASEGDMSAPSSPAVAAIAATVAKAFGPGAATYSVVSGGSQAAAPAAATKAVEGKSAAAPAEELQVISALLPARGSLSLNNSDIAAVAAVVDEQVGTEDLAPGDQIESARCSNNTSIDAQSAGRLATLEADVALLKQQLQQLLEQQQAPAVVDCSTQHAEESTQAEQPSEQAPTSEQPETGAAFPGPASASDELSSLKAQVAELQTSVGGLTAAAAPPQAPAEIEDILLPFMETTSKCLQLHEQQLDALQGLAPKLEGIVAQRAQMVELMQQVSALQTAFNIVTGQNRPGSSGGTPAGGLLAAVGPLASNKAATDHLVLATNMVKLQSQMGALSALVEQLQMEWESTIAGIHREHAANKDAWENEQLRLAASEREAVRRLEEQQEELRVREDRLVQIREAAIAEEAARRDLLDVEATLTRKVEGLAEQHDSMKEHWTGVKEASEGLERQLRDFKSDIEASLVHLAEQMAQLMATQDELQARVGALEPATAAADAANEPAAEPAPGLSVFQSTVQDATRFTGDAAQAATADSSNPFLTSAPAAPEATAPLANHDDQLSDPHRQQQQPNSAGIFGVSQPATMHEQLGSAGPAAEPQAETAAAVAANLANAPAEGRAPAVAAPKPGWLWKPRTLSLGGSKSEPDSARIVAAAPVGEQQPFLARNNSLFHELRSKRSSNRELAAAAAAATHLDDELDANDDSMDTPAALLHGGYMPAVDDEGVLTGSILGAAAAAVAAANAAVLAGTSGDVAVNGAGSNTVDQCRPIDVDYSAIAGSSGNKWRSAWSKLGFRGKSMSRMSDVQPA